MLQRCANDVLPNSNPSSSLWLKVCNPSHLCNCLTQHSSLFIWRCLGRPSWCSQQHFLFLPKVDRVTLTLSPLEAT
ncbi:hypothetical protein Q5P01_015722 [Channa striata]|uniref:Uncharacterized protein n=1 Tax=Channa striata TaxID=64152 RepID=A0AA88MCV0_CHASR|nr:hypothetical protein Q5P01_015722 [Channa striata]